jgi:hypothetical protein
MPVFRRASPLDGRATHRETNGFRPQKQRAPSLGATKRKEYAQEDSKHNEMVS